MLTAVILPMLLTAAIILFVLKSLYLKRKLLKFSSMIEGHRFYPIIGNGYHLFKKDFLSGIRSFTSKFGSPCNMWLGHDYCYITTDAQETKIILTNQDSLEKASFYQLFANSFGSSSLFLMPVEPWKRLRKTFNKSFHQTLLVSFVEIFDRKARVLCEELKNDVKDKFEVFERFSVDTILATQFGIDYRIQETRHFDMAELFAKMQTLTTDIIYASVFLPKVVWYNSTTGKKFTKILNKCYEEMAKILSDNRERYNKENRDYTEEKNKILIDGMLESKGFSDKDIFDESILFIAAATDTTGGTLVYFFLLIGMYPEIQEKLYNEVVQTVGLDREIIYSDLANLKYLERVLYESMRLLPVAPLIARQVTKDIDTGTSILPKGANVIINIYDLHRNAKYYKNPKDFNPDRFLPEEIQKRDSFGYTFLPFSAGPRNCIGKTYAMIMMKIVIANIVRKYKTISLYNSIDDIELVSLLTSRPKNGRTDFYFEKRTHTNQY